MTVTPFDFQYILKNVSAAVKRTEGVRTCRVLRINLKMESLQKISAVTLFQINTRARI